MASLFLHTNFEQRDVIKFCTRLGEKPLNKMVQAYREDVLSYSRVLNKMVQVYREDVLSYSRVKDWAKRFREGRESIEDDEKFRRPIFVITPHTIDMVRNITGDDPTLLLQR